jgi:hypothetical protein
MVEYCRGTERKFQRRWGAATIACLAATTLVVSHTAHAQTPKYGVPGYAPKQTTTSGDVIAGFAPMGSGAKYGADAPINPPKQAITPKYSAAAGAPGYVPKSTFAPKYQAIPSVGSGYVPKYAIVPKYPGSPGFVPGYLPKYYGTPGFVPGYVPKYYAAPKYWAHPGNAAVYRSQYGHGWRSSQHGWAHNSGYRPKYSHGRQHSYMTQQQAYYWR